MSTTPSASSKRVTRFTTDGVMRPYVRRSISSSRSTEISPSLSARRVERKSELPPSTKVLVANSNFFEDVAPRRGFFSPEFRFFELQPLLAKLHKVLFVFEKSPPLSQRQPVLCAQPPAPARRSEDLESFFRG